MLLKGLPLETVRLVSPRAVRGYAERLGWQHVVDIEGRITVYQNPRDSLRQLIVPVHERLDDYAERTVEAIHKLAEFENRPAHEVLEDLLHPRFPRNP
ncbi:MAG TPA: hypothetical protein VNH11_18010 [Pirellulales bacterium]|nr:hypothetical protein [Pirellulales bacterium]